MLWSYQTRVIVSVYTDIDGSQFAAVCEQKNRREIVYSNAARGGWVVSYAH